MTKDEVLSILREHLAVDVTVTQKTKFGPSEVLEVKVVLTLDGDAISTSVGYDQLPSR